MWLLDNLKLPMWVRFKAHLIFLLQYHPRCMSVNTRTRTTISKSRLRKTYNGWDGQNGGAVAGT